MFGFQLVEDFSKLLIRPDRLLIDGDDDIASQDPRLAFDHHIEVAGPEAGLFSRTTVLDIEYEQALHQRQRDQVPQFIGDEFPLHAEPWTNDMAIDPQLGDDGFDGIDRNRETDILSLHHDGRIDADHPTVRIDQRPAAVAGINRGGCLNGMLKGLLFGVFQLAEPADDSC